ncbi:uncharacterized protein DMAD_00142 [Drosophila madeirensis]|uniref:Cerebellar degeneration-related protein 2-like n=1 Tax=Drosophila madeirensis TaxID=30013 RepID=A0AAU9FXP5_DROMD
MDETNRDVSPCDAQDVSQFMLDDLQLAAELGKTLLERNKELEIFLKEYKSKGDEQEREIVHLRKHINAMTEVNDSRLKVYEQLEVGIQDLERANQRLNIEKNSDKKLIKMISSNTEILEARCEELSQLLNESKQTLNIERRRGDRLQQELNNSVSLSDNQIGDRNDKVINSRNDYNIQSFDFNCKATDQHSFEHRDIANSTGVEELLSPNDSLPLVVVNNASDKVAAKGEDNEELVTLISELELVKRELFAEQKRYAELEEQLMAIIQENQGLQTRLSQNNANEEMMSMHDEFSLLDDVRQGQMCSRCLGVIDGRRTNVDEQSSIDQMEEIYEDEQNMTDLENQSEVDLVTNHISKFSNCTPGCSYKERFPDSLNPKAINNFNPYQDLVKKYEALVEVQRTSIAAKNVWGNDKESEKENKFSHNLLHLESVGMHARKEDGIVADTSKQTGVMSNNGVGRTPTEFSEVETSSSGYSDDTSNKYTQTDERPGYFLCSISDGKDCKFSIYDDVSPIDSHFRHRPEYRELFKEIFGVLKKSAENNEVGEKLSLLEHSDSVNRVTSETSIISAVTPVIEEHLEESIDETQSIVSSVISNNSIAISECITKIERKTAKKHIHDLRSYQNKSPLIKEASNSQVNMSKMKGSESLSKIRPIEENGRIFTPIKREPLEYLTVAVGIKKKNRRKHRNLSTVGDRFERKLWDDTDKKGLTNGDQCGNLNNRPKSSEKCNTDNRGLGRDVRNRNSDLYNNWNGSPMVIYNRNMNKPQSARGRVIELNGVEFYHNTVSQELHKLKKLDLSYADVLRRADTCEHMHSKFRSPRLNGIKKNPQQRQ